MQRLDPNSSSNTTGGFSPALGATGARAAEIDVERTDAGLQVRLRPRGLARFIPAAFLIVWLCGWAVGEAFALWILVRGAVALATGQSMSPGQEPLAWAPALMMGLFLLFWLTLWTFGGIHAIRELLRSLWGEDRLIAGSNELIRESCIGPFRVKRMFPHADLVSVRVSPRTGALVVETRTERMDLSQLGTRPERERAAEILAAELRLAERVSEAAAALPVGWLEVPTAEGAPALVPDPATRSKQARVIGVLTLAFATITALLFQWAARDLGVLPLALIIAAGTAGLIWSFVWLSRGRIEWRIGSGRLVQQRRFGSQLRETFEAIKLELTSTRDSDGDDWVVLEALALGADTQGPVGSTWATRTPAQRKLRRRVLQAMNDDESPRRLARWLSQRAELPLVDRTTPEMQQAEIAELKKKLENTGKIGVLAVRWIERASEVRKAA